MSKHVYRVQFASIPDVSIVATSLENALEYVRDKWPKREVIICVTETVEIDGFAADSKKP